MDRLSSKELSLTDVTQQVQRNVFPLNIDTVNCMLEACIQHDSPILGLEVFAAMQKTYGLVPDEFTLQALVHLTRNVFNAENTSALPPGWVCIVLIFTFAEEDMQDRRTWLRIKYICKIALRIMIRIVS